MKTLKTIGLSMFFVGLVIFTLSPLAGSFKLTEEVMQNNLTEKELANLEEPFREQILDKEYATSYAFSKDVISIYNGINQNYRANQQWDEVMHTLDREFAYKLARASSYGFIKDNGWLMFFLTFGLCIIGALIYILTDLKLLGPPGIKNNRIYHTSLQNRGWFGMVAFTWLFSFYIILYFHPYIFVNLTHIVDPVKRLFLDEPASQWFLYGMLYTVSMGVMGVRMIIKYRHNNYQMIRTGSVFFFQLIFAFLLAEILPIFGMPGQDLKNIMPLNYTFLYKYNVQEMLAAGQFGMFLLAWGFILAFVAVPVLAYFYGKRWYCSWVCGCGGLAETLGDPFRQLSSKKLWAWKLERWLVHSILVAATVLLIITGYHSYTAVTGPEGTDGQTMLFGISVYNYRDWYGFLIGSIFAGVIGTGFYPILGNRAWCRFGCPLAAYLGIVQRFKSRFRITTNGGQCISCGNCSTYCEQGIDVKAYAQRGQNIIRASCVGCGVCAAVCPRGVLKLENGPEEGRFGDEGPIVLGNNGFEIRD